MKPQKSRGRPKVPAWKAFFLQQGPLLLKALAILAAGTAVMYPTLNAGWFGDDDLYLITNTLLKDPDRVWKAWFQPGSFIEYYPIEQTVQWCQWKLWGLTSTFGYHLTNLVLHLTSALLLWRLFSKLGLKCAWLGGLIFAIHPMMVDSVGVACELKNTLSLPPFLLAMCFYLDFENSRKPRSYFFALLWFLVAMLCKITMFFFPFVILLYAWWKRDRIAWSDLKASLPFFAISLVLGWTTLHAGVVYAEATHYQSPGPIHLGGIENRIALAGLTLAFYLGRCFFPLHPLPFYPLWPIEPVTPLLFAPWLVIAFVLFWCWRKRHSWGRTAFFGLAFFALGLVPFLGLNETSYMCLTWVADHFAYIPMIGLIGLVLAGLDHLGKQLPRSILPVGLAILVTALGLLGYQSYSYATLFTDREMYWIYVLRYDPNLWLARSLVGQAYFDKRDFQKASEQLKESVRLNPDFYNAQLFLGLSLCNLDKFSEGAGALQAAVRINPRNLDGHWYLALALLQTGRLSEAIDQFNTVLQVQPNAIAARCALSYAFAQQGRISDAIHQIATALDQRPGDPQLLARMKELENAQRQQVKPPSRAPVPPK